MIDCGKDAKGVEFIISIIDDYEQFHLGSGCISKKVSGNKRKHA